MLVAIACHLLLVAVSVAGDTCTRHDGRCDLDSEQADAGSCFRAAVFEHKSPVFGEYGKTLELYAKAAKVAANNGAKVMVFPEGGFGMPQEFQEIPDPDQLNANNSIPCLEPRQFETSSGLPSILTHLSCIARENKLYLVANYATKQSCRPHEKVGERTCPYGGFRLNTDVVLDPQGRFIKRYRKYNLWPQESAIYSHPPSLEEVYFDTPYGRFGVFTCFDMVFKWPAVNLVEKHHIDTVLFPTLWHDEAPIFSGTQAQDGWSRAHQVNLLAANMLIPEQGAVGSGIYSLGDSVFTTADSTSNKLLLANVATNPRSRKCSQEFEPTVIEIDDGKQRAHEYEFRNYELKASDKIVSPLPARLSGETFCSGKICCRVNYNIRRPVSEATLAKLVLIVRNDNRAGMGFNFYEQVCLLATLEKPLDPKRLREVAFALEPLVEFENLSLEATFESRHVMPMASSSLSRPIDREDHQFGCSEQGGIFRCEHSYHPRQSGEKIYAFSMYGRIYGRDKLPPGWVVASD